MEYQKSKATLKTAPDEKCTVVTRFPEVSGEVAAAIASHMQDELAGIEAYRGIMPLNREEHKREVGRTAFKVVFGTTDLAFIEGQTAYAANVAGEKEGVPVMGLLAQPVQLTRMLGRWARSRGIGT